MAAEDLDGRAPRSSAATVSARRAFGDLWRRIEPYFGGNGRRLALFVVVSTLNGFGEAAVLYLVVRIATGLAASEDTVTVDIGPLAERSVEISHLIGIAAAILVLLVALAAMSAALSARMCIAALINARRRTFDAFIRGSWDIQSRERGGHLQELLSTHTRKIAQGVMIITDGMTASISFLAFFVSALVISPLAAIVILIGVIGLYLALVPITRITKKRSRQHADANTDYALSVAQAVALAREIRAFDVTEHVRRSIADEGDAVGRLGFSTRLLGKLTPKLYQNAALLLVLVGLGGVYLADVGNATELGVVVLLLVRGLTYSQLLQESVQLAGETAPYLEGLQGHEARYEQHAVRSGPIALDPVDSLRFTDVSFEYDPGRPVLQEVSFAVTRGETIGVVGPSGSGKSTLVQLLLGLRVPAAGDYLVNGRPAADHSTETWFRQFVFVPQDNQLLRATVADNIRFFRSWIDHREIERAARRAHLHDEITAMPCGYATVIGSGAMDLSGGQRQRVGLARALAGDPSVLVLDEPTSALDMRSESLIRETLDELRGRVTVIIVAHRMSTLSRCDRIMVVRHGRIDAFDTPERLTRSNRFFREANELSRST